MYPIDFPLRIIGRYGKKGDWVLDPFCGRGTTNYAARLHGLASVGVDSSPVAVAIAKSKVVSVSADAVCREAERILKGTHLPSLPHGAFWKRCFCPEVLRDLSKFRYALMKDCRSKKRQVLRAIILGALHGPLAKKNPSFFSNQNPRTFAPKPRYALHYWRKRKLYPPQVSVLAIIKKRADWFLKEQVPSATGIIRLGDSRRISSIKGRRRYSLVITSPPYYGMRTYVQDQWIRNWFLGGPDKVDYRITPRQVLHNSPAKFASELSKVWANAALASKPGARLIVRFGGINIRRQDPAKILKDSLVDTNWRIETIRPAGSARDGKRQAEQFSVRWRRPIPEFDLYARLVN